MIVRIKTYEKEHPYEQRSFADQVRLSELVHESKQMRHTPSDVRAYFSAKVSISLEKRIFSHSPGT
ncbi:MAG: hypothetical protein LAP86_34940 [Acidobacteriia bacterium]|nr:hypothetical protein [Terriglobia bacterium]